MQAKGRSARARAGGGLDMPRFNNAALGTVHGWLNNLADLSRLRSTRSRKRSLAHAGLVLELLAALARSRASVTSGLSTDA